MVIEELLSENTSKTVESVGGRDRKREQEMLGYRQKNRKTCDRKRPSQQHDHQCAGTRKWE